MSLLKKDKLFDSQNLAIFFILLYLLFSIVWHFSTNAPWDDDCVTRYFKTKNAFNNPESFISPWNRPLFAILFVIPFQISKHMVLLMSLISAASAFALFRSCQLLNIKNAALCIPLMVFQAFYFTISRSALAEPLISAILCFGLYFYLNKKYFWFAVVGAFIPLSRLELSPFLLIWAYLLFKENKLKYILILGVPTLLWNFAGTAMDGDLLWLYERTIGKDTGSNRYGNTTFWHYFRRYIFVTGPIVFYFFSLGLLKKLISRKLHALLAVQFILGFMIYVLFSWKLSLGQAAGFLRHLITLSPIAAILAVQGYNYWMASIRSKNAENKLPNENLSKEINKSQKISELQEEIESIKNQEEEGAIKKRKARHLINEIENRLKKIEEPQKAANKQSEKSKSKSNKHLLVVLHGLALAAVSYFYFSKELLIHHKFGDENDYSFTIILVSLIATYLLLKVIAQKVTNFQFFRNIVTLLLVLSAASFTLITEPPNAHNSKERLAMTKIANIYFNSNLQEHKTYVNHNWFFWEEDENREDEKYGTITKENIESASEEAVIIWDSHYSHRLLGDVQESYFNGKAEFLELVKISSPTFNFNSKIYQKIAANASTAQKLAYHNEFIQQFPELDEAYISRGRTKLAAKDVEGALADYNKAISLDSNDYISLIERGNLFFNRNDFPNAIKDFKRTTVVNQKNYLGYYNTAISYRRMNQLDSSLVYLNQAAERNKKQANIFIERGSVYFNKNNFMAALGDFSKAVELDGKNNLAYFNLAVTYLKQNKLEEACSNLKLAKQYGNKNADAAIRQYCMNVKVAK